VINGNVPLSIPGRHKIIRSAGGAAEKPAFAG
jgi:hypothetical protein